MSGFDGVSIKVWNNSKQPENCKVTEGVKPCPDCPLWGPLDFAADRLEAERDDLRQRLAERTAERDALRAELEWIANHEAGNIEPGDLNRGRAGWEMSQRARAAIAKLEANNGR